MVLKSEELALLLLPLHFIGESLKIKEFYKKGEVRKYINKIEKRMLKK